MRPVLKKSVAPLLPTPAYCEKPMLNAVPYWNSSFL